MEGSNANIDELIAVNLSTLKNKPELQAKLKEFQDALRNLHEEMNRQPADQITDILSRLTSLEEKEESSKLQLKTLRDENTALKKRLHEIESHLDETEDRFVEIEKGLTGVEQYTRRENFEISGIPADLPHYELKGKVLNIANTLLDRTQDPVTAKDIHACHRLKVENGKAAVIVRMVNREDTVAILKSKKTLPEKSNELGFPERLYINENLCNRTKDIYSEARKLKKKGLLSSCWTYNGIVHIKKRDSEPKGKKIFHLADLENYFTLKQLGWE